jgi:pantetheine-phosphate adenylyltransferase
VAPEVETIFMMSRGEYSFISSNMVKEVASYGGDISTLVPQFVQKKLQDRYAARSQ